MTAADFLSLYKATLVQIEDCVENAIVRDDADIDYESGNDMLTLMFRDRSVAIISRQSAIEQLWLAARSGGFHFTYRQDAAQWVCMTTGEQLPKMLADICLAQGGVHIDFANAP